MRTSLICKAEPAYQNATERKSFLGLLVRHYNGNWWLVHDMLKRYVKEGNEKEWHGDGQLRDVSEQGREKLRAWGDTPYGLKSVDDTSFNHWRQQSLSFTSAPYARGRLRETTWLRLLQTY